MHDLAAMLAEIAGMDAVSLQPAAGAQGEFAGVLMIRAYHASRGEKRTKVLIPDSAHGTNPASTAIAGYEVVEVKSLPNGEVDLDALTREVGPDVAAFMITVPNTLGMFEPRIMEITEICHAKGVQVYMDGANLNAILGITRPGDLGFDVCHFNLHKTFTTPHGGGGPGAGPGGIKAHLEPFLPAPVVVKDGDTYALDDKRPKSIGKLQAFWGNFGMVVRAYAYIRTMGADGLRSVSDNAVLNANYIMKRLEADYDVSVPGPCMHECVLSARRQKGPRGFPEAARASGEMGAMSGPRALGVWGPWRGPHLQTGASSSPSRAAAPPTWRSTRRSGAAATRAPRRPPCASSRGTRRRCRSDTASRSTGTWTSPRAGGSASASCAARRAAARSITTGRSGS